MNNITRPDAFVSQVAKIHRSDRWSVYRRLQELNISCWCPQDGTLWVEIDHCIDAILLRSTIQQFASTRYELTDWLERCWETESSVVSR
ncbi:MAG: Asr1405/Asl0597 family protein [Cyanophyceae cyanobacterium]